MFIIINYILHIHLLDVIILIALCFISNLIYIIALKLDISFRFTAIEFINLKGFN